MKPLLTKAIWIAAFLTISYFIGEVTRANMDWYDTLKKSPFNPPKLAFPIVWTSLYIMLAIVASNLWAVRKTAQGKLCTILFAGYMVMNWAWSFIFFVGHLVFAGFIWIVLSDILLAVTLFKLWQSGQKLNAALILPTLLWGTFAAYLNGYIYVVS